MAALSVNRLTLIVSNDISKKKGYAPWPSGYDAWLPSVSLPIKVSAGSPIGLTWLLYKCVALWRAVYGPSATELASWVMRWSTCHAKCICSLYSYLRVGGAIFRLETELNYGKG